MMRVGSGRPVRTRWWICCAVVVVFGRPPALRAQMMDNMIYSFALLDRLEYRGAGKAAAFQHDFVGWVGGDIHRLWFKSEGAFPTGDGGTDFDVQALYGKLVLPYWDLQVGGRLEVQAEGGTTRTRAFAAIGLEGLAPYWFDVEPTLFLSQDGDLSARLTISYDMFLGQRLIAQPRTEMNAALQAVPDFGVSAGLNDLDLGMRLRYELRRELAPYVGVSWLRQFAGAAVRAREDGRSAGRASFVVGVRAWF